MKADFTVQPRDARVARALAGLIEEIDGLPSPPDEASLVACPRNRAGALHARCGGPSNSIAADHTANIFRAAATFKLAEFLHAGLALAHGNAFDPTATTIILPQR